MCSFVAVIDLDDIELAGKMSVVDLPYPAQVNCLTAQIDVDKPKAFVRQLHQCYSEIFTGWGRYQGLNGGLANTAMRKLAAAVAQIIQSNHEDDLVVISGVGAAGRIAYDLVRTTNDLLRREYNCGPRYKYISAGGDCSLYPDEDLLQTYCLDDSAERGSEDLQEACQGAGHVVFIGIDFDLSSAYVAGQLAMCVQEKNQFTPVLVTATATEHASQMKLGGVDFTVYDVVRRVEAMASHDHAIILRPVFGPEPLAGALDMKHGSGLYIQLATVFLLAHLQLENKEHKQICASWPILDAFRHVLDGLYHREENNMADLVYDVTEKVSRGGHVYYIGEDDLGAMGIISTADSAYNYRSTEARAFVRRRVRRPDAVNTRDRMPARNGHGPNTTNEVAEPPSRFSSKKDVVLELDEKVFIDHIRPTLTNDDIVILLVSHLDEVPDYVSNTGCAVIVINFITPDSKKLKLNVVAKCKSVVQFTVPEVEKPAGKTRVFDKLVRLFFKQFACRLVCNVAEAAAHGKLGRTYRNYLADFSICNWSSYGRAIKYLQLIAGLSSDAARELLLKCIYEKDVIAAELYKPLPEHIEKALDTEHVMMTAVYCALTKCKSVESGLETVRTEPNLRQLLNA